MQLDDQIPDFRQLVSCACLNVRQAARAVTAFYDKMLEPAGVRTTQFAVLAMIRLAGAAPLSTLAQALGLDPSTLSRTMQPLIDRGLVQVETGDDQRVREAVLTAAGHKTTAAAFEHWAEAQNRVAELLGGERFERMIADLGALSRIKG